MATHRKPQKVYMSYARGDAPRLEQILKTLTAMGLLSSTDEVLSDRDLEPGHAELRGGVKRQIQSASKVVVVWTSASARSQWVNYEIGLADAFGKAIIPVVRRTDVASLPELLKQFQAVVLDDDA